MLNCIIVSVHHLTIYQPRIRESTHLDVSSFFNLCKLNHQSAPLSAVIKSNTDTLNAHHIHCQYTDCRARQMFSLVIKSCMNNSTHACLISSESTAGYNLSLTIIVESVSKNLKLNYRNKIIILSSSKYYIDGENPV